MNTAAFFLTATPTTEIYTLSLHDALPICTRGDERRENQTAGLSVRELDRAHEPAHARGRALERTGDRKSTRLNSSHMSISYAVFCLKKKKKSTFNCRHRRCVQAVWYLLIA